MSPRRVLIALVLLPAISGAGPSPARGSAFDLSMPFPKPGSQGRVVRDGNDLRFDKDPHGTHRVFVGTNLTGEACFPTSNGQATAWARSLRLRGYNAVRLHHIDWVIRDRGWQFKANADRFIAALKRESIYVTIDLFSDRAKDREGFKRGVLNGDPKIRFDWATYARRLLTIQSGSNGCEAWKDEPAIIGLCPVNEDDPRFLGVDPSKYGQAFAWMIEVVRGVGYKGLVWGLNSGIDKKLVDQTTLFEAEDVHVYWDHPQGEKYFTTSGVRQWWQLPNPERKDLPLICTEWGSLPFNPFRGETGLLLAGEMAHRQASCVLSFALATNADMMTESKAVIDQFALHTDPVRLATDRAAVLLLRRPGQNPKSAWDGPKGTYDYESASAKIHVWGGGPNRAQDFVASLDRQPLAQSKRLLLIRFGDAQNSGFQSQPVERVINRVAKKGDLPVQEFPAKTPYEFDSQRNLEAWSLDSYTGQRLRKVKCEQTKPGHWRIQTDAINTELISK